MPATTPRLSLPYPLASDPDDVPADLLALATALDTVVQTNAETVSTAGGDTITASAAGVIPLVVRGATGQTANLLEARDAAGVVRSSVTENGNLAVGDQAAADAGILSVMARSGAGLPLVVRGAASQTANLSEWQDSAGTVLARVSAAGSITTEQTLQAGPAASLPAGGQVRVAASGATVQGLVVRGAASQTANLAEFQNSAGTVLNAIKSDGTQFITDAVAGAVKGTAVGSIPIQVGGTVRYLNFFQA